MKRNRLLSMVLIVTMLLSVFQGALPVMGATSSMVGVDASAANWTTAGLGSSDVTGGASFACDAAAYGTRAILNTQLDVTEAVEFNLKFTKETMASGNWFAIMFGVDESSFNNTVKGTTFLMYKKGNNVIQCTQGGTTWREYTYANDNTFRFVKETDGWALYLKGTTDIQFGKVGFDVFPADGFTNNKATFGVYVYDANALTFEVTNVKYQVTQETDTNIEDLVDFVVDVEEGRDIKVLQLTDTQIINASEKRYSSAINNFQTQLYDANAITFSYKNTVTDVIEQLKPDFIIVTGDQVYGKFDDSGKNHADFVDFMDSFQIPWAPIFGNHELETNVGADTYCQQYEDAEYCLFKQNTITGNGNYTVALRQGGEVKRVFFMMDSNGTGAASRASKNNGQTRTSAGFASDQVEWFSTLGAAINEAAPEAKISFAFHWPIQAVYDALALYGWEEGGSYTNNPIFIEEAENRADTDFGFIASGDGGAWDTDYSCYNAMKAIGVDSIFVGHIHATSASIVKDGVRFQFGLKTGVYDARLTKMSDGTYDGGFAVGGKPYIGGSAIIVSEEDGSIENAYHVYHNMENDQYTGELSTVAEPADGQFKGYEYTKYQLSDVAGELQVSNATEYYDVGKDSYSVAFDFTAAETFSLTLRLLSDGTSSSGFPITITNDGVSIVNETVGDGKTSMSFTSGEIYNIEVGAVKVYDGNTYYLYVKVNGEVATKWRYEEVAAYTLGSKLGVKYTETIGEEESAIVTMSTLLQNPDQVQPCGFNADGSYYTAWKINSTIAVKDTGIDYTLSSHTNGEFYYNAEAEGFSLDFTATQASDPWKTGSYNTAANNDYLFITLRSNGNYLPWNSVNDQGYIFSIQRVKNGSRTATKVTVYADTADSGWADNCVGSSSWYNGDLFDGKTRKIEVSAVNNEENTAVVLRFAVDGKEYFHQTYNATPLPMENTCIKMVDYVDGGTQTGILYKFTEATDIDYTTGKELVESGRLVTTYSGATPVTITDDWAYSAGTGCPSIYYNDTMTAVDFDIVVTNPDAAPNQLALVMRANGTGTLWNNSQGYTAFIQGTKVEISKTKEKYTAAHTNLVTTAQAGTIANIFDGQPHNIKFYAVDGADGKVYGGLSIDGATMITFVDTADILSIKDTNFKIIGVNGQVPTYRIGELGVEYVDLTDKIDEYRTSGEAPEYGDMLFAGWYDAEGNALGINDTATSYCAKFLPKEVLQVKAQLKLGEGVSATDASGTTEMRLITTVDESLDYMEVGFIVTSGSNSQTYVRNTAYASLLAAGVTMTPDVFHVCSKQFITVNLGNLIWNTDTKPADREITVQAYWKTYDGTIVYGAARTLTIQQGLDVINATTQAYSL